MGLQIYAPISRFSKPILQLFYIKTLTDCYDGKYLWNKVETLWSYCVLRGILLCFYKKRERNSVDRLNEKNRKDSSTSSEWQGNPSLVVFLGWDAETSSARLDN